MFQHPVQYVKKTTVQVVEASITVIISPIQDYTLAPRWSYSSHIKRCILLPNKVTGILISGNLKILLPCLCSYNFVEPDVETV